MLAQIPLAYGISEEVAQLASEAAQLMDRFPVADEASTDTTREPPKSNLGFGETGDAPVQVESDIEIELNSLVDDRDTSPLDEDELDGRDDIDILDRIFSGSLDIDLEEERFEIDTIETRERKSSSTSNRGSYKNIRKEGGVSLDDVDLSEFGNDETSDESIIDESGGNISSDKKSKGFDNLIEDLYMLSKEGEKDSTSENLKLKKNKRIAKNDSRSRRK